jgi:hypothetical protein
MAPPVRGLPAETADELDEEMFAFNYELSSTHS